MRLLHTADWHLGAKTDDYDRLPEQRQALKQIVKIAKEQNVDMVIIAGDIYDSLIPTSEAEDLFYKTISELNNNGNTIVVAIAGNHDEPKRISNTNVFSNKFGIFIIGDLEKLDVPTKKTDRNIYPVKSGKGFIEFKTQAGEDVVLAYLPYPSYYRFKEIKKSGEDFSDKVKEWLSYGTSAFKENSINLLTAHLTAYANDMETDDYEAYTTISSNSSFVRNDVIQTGAMYTALGHIHKNIAVDKTRNIYYSGSLINNFFHDGVRLTKVNVVDVTADGVQKIEKFPLDVKLLREEKVNTILQAELVCKDHPDDLLKVIVENVDRVSIEDIKHLRSNYKNLITLSVITKDAIKQDNIVSKKDLTNAEIFDSFCISKKGKISRDEVRELFLELMSEDLYEAD